MTKMSKSRGWIGCAGIALVTALVSFGFFILRSGGTFTLVDDFNYQQLTFTAAVRHALLGGGAGEWNWNLDLGSSLVTGYSFYNLGSPFFWLGVLFPSSLFPYAIGWIYVLKYVTAAVLAYGYLHLFTKERTAAAGALLYAFCGFQSVNLEFYHFHDVVAFFPLLLWSLEKLIAAGPDSGRNSDRCSSLEINRENGRETGRENDRGTGRNGGRGRLQAGSCGRGRALLMFAAAVFLNCSVNYFFFVQEVVFLVLYFVVRCFGRPVRRFLADALRAALGGIWGVAMAAALFIPNVLYLLSNSRSESNVYLSNLVYDTKDFLMILKGMLLPGDAMNRQSALYEGQWDSTGCWLPMVGAALPLAFMAGVWGKRNWLRTLLLILTVVSFSPLAQSGFLLFTATYQRWWYMYALMLSLASALVLERPEAYPVRRGVIAGCCLVIGLYAGLRYMDWAPDMLSTVYDMPRLQVLCAAAVSGMVLTWLLCRRHMRLMVTGIAAYAAFSTMLCIGLYKIDGDGEEILRRYSLGAVLPVVDEQYRYSSSDNMITLTGEAAGVGCFCTTVENSSRTFDRIFGHISTNSTTMKSDVRGLTQLLGGNYEIWQDAAWQDADRDGVVTEVSSGGQTYYIVETEACPIGFALDHYVTRKKIMKVDTEDRAVLLMGAAAIRTEDRAVFAEQFHSIDTETYDYDRLLSEYIAETQAARVLDFQRDATGFSCRTDYDARKIVFFTVPWDAGWTALVDGAEAQIYDACGMMSLIVPEGEHAIEFVYRTPGLRFGGAVSAAAWGLFVAAAVVLRRRRRKTLRKVRGARY